MAETSYNYTISVDFPNGKANVDTLEAEVVAQIPSPELISINSDVVPDICTIVFADALSAGEKTTLDGVVAIHQGLPQFVISPDAPGWNFSALSMSLTAPPEFPNQGDCYIVPLGATGAWAGRDGQVACWDGSNWIFTPGEEGLAGWVIDTSQVTVFTSGAWEVSASLAAHANALSPPSGVYGEDYTRVDSPAAVVTTITNWMEKASLTKQATNTGKFKVTFAYGWNVASTSYSFEGRVGWEYDGGGYVPLGEVHRQEAKDSGGSWGSTGTDQRLYIERSFEVDMDADKSGTFILEFRSTKKKTEASMFDASITFKRVN